MSFARRRGPRRTFYRAVAAMVSVAHLLAACSTNDTTTVAARTPVPPPSLIPAQKMTTIEPMPISTKVDALPVPAGFPRDVPLRTVGLRVRFPEGTGEDFDWGGEPAIVLQASSQGEYVRLPLEVGAEAAYLLPDRPFGLVQLGGNRPCVSLNTLYHRAPSPDARIDVPAAG